MKRNSFQWELNKRLKRFGSNHAIEYGDQVWTYEELDKQSDGIRDWLVEKGIQPETFVGVLAGHRAVYISAIIGILKAGCAFVPLDPANPDDRLIRMIDVIHLKIIFIDEDYQEFSTSPLMEEREITFISLEELVVIGKGSEGTSISNPQINYSPEDKIYVYFTSGTTSLPRAIVGKSKSLLHYCEWEIETFDLDDRLRLSQFATTSDAFLKEIFVTFLCGGTLCIPENFKEILYSQALIDWVESSRINVIHCVPHVFRILSTGQLTPAHLMNLKYLVLSGEEIFPHDLNDWYNKIGERVQLVNLYGTTETTILNTCYFIQPSDVHRERIPLGKPIKGNRVIILDENMNICAKSIAGEIYIRTPFRTFGYYNDDDLNKEKFVKNPFSEDPDDLIFKTGDLGRLLPDDNIELLGRIDRQVKIRGHRIELREIEHALIQFPTVKEAVVIKKEISANNELLWAYVTEDEENPENTNEELSASQLKEYLSGKLPDYMIPNQIIKLKKIPRKPNRKIDYHLLPDPFTGKERGYTPPQNDVERKLAALWSETLKIEKISVNDNFFELGGSSLNVFSLTYKIHREFNIRFSLGEIFNNPTIKEQAALIEPVPKDKDKYVSIETAEKKEYYPVSSAQKRLYVIRQMAPENTDYNISQVVLIEEELDTEKFEKICNRLIKRHESLRTSFELIGKEPVQRIHDPDNVEFKPEYYDITGSKESSNGSHGLPLEQLLVRGRDAAFTLSNHIVKNFIRPFDLSRSPLLRVGFIKIEEGKHILMLDMHHIVSDALSQAILIREFMVLYRGKGLTPMRLQYRDFSHWQNKRNQSEEIKKQERYWLDLFEGEIPNLNLPIDYLYQPAQPGEGQHIRFSIEPRLCTQLKELVKESGATLYMLLLAGYNILLSKYTNQEDIVVGTPISGRNHADLENLIGMFVNMLPIRSKPEGNKTLGEFIGDIKENTLKAFNNQDFQFDDLVSKLGLIRNETNTPLTEVVFNMVSLDDKQNDLKNADESIHFKSPQNRFDINKVPFNLLLNATETDDTINMILTYSNSLFKKETIERMAEHYVHIIKQIVMNNGIKLADIKISHDLLTIKPTSLREDQNVFHF